MDINKLAIQILRDLLEVYESGGDMNDMARTVADFVESLPDSEGESA